MVNPPSELQDHPQTTPSKNICFIRKIFFPSIPGKSSRSQVFFTYDGIYYRVDSPLFVDDINESNVMQFNPVLLPEEHLFPVYVSGFRMVALQDAAEHYIKMPNFTCYNPDEPYDLANRLLQEVQIMEALSKSPHVNIVKYMGCIVEKGRIRGICMKQCLELLYDRVASKKMIIKENVINSIRKAVVHMHNLGYCHNDISPWNVMFRKDDSVTIIDFDSCHPTGQNLGRKRGTRGFFDKAATISTPANDFYSIARMEEYLETGELPKEFTS